MGWRCFVTLKSQAPPDAGAIELWQGQVAAFERSLAMASLSFSQADIIDRVTGLEPVKYQDAATGFGK